MIYVRDDDVLLPSSSYDNPFGRFKQIHEWITECDKFMHVPAILTTEIQEFPECIEYIKEETKAGRMRPELHGVQHIDYGKLSTTTTMEHLHAGSEWMREHLGIEPTVWYTPWGASQPHLHKAADQMQFKLVDCSQINKMQGRYGICQRLKDGHDISFLEEQEIFMHWWEGGARLKRIIESVKHGSWIEAKKQNRQLFRD
jgi:hypothetical protein